MTVLEHLRQARDHLADAEDEASTGTSLMIRPIRQELSELITRTENIQDDRSE